MTTNQQVLDRLERRSDVFEAVVNRALRRAIRAGIGDLGKVITAAITPEPELPPQEPTGSAYTSFDDLAAINTAWQQELSDRIIPEITRLVALGAEDALNDIADEVDMPLNSLVARVPVLISGRHPAAEMHISESANRLRGIGDDLWRKTRQQLVSGVTEGDSIPQLSKRVRGELAVTANRAKTIARTEVISASNAGSFFQVMALPPDIRPQSKTWLATNDTRTRLSHRVADGQTEPLEENFTVGGASLKYPGDPIGPPDEIINCRCTLTWNMQEDD